jgi:prepilin-type N-terminal cleavage/methylation domain-containing protein
MAKSRHSSGVTLIEILVVLGIIAVLSAIVITATLRVDNQSKENALNSAFTLIGSALREYYEVKGQFPPQPDRRPADALIHIEAMYQALWAEPASRQVLGKLSSAVVKSDGTALNQQAMYDPWGTVMDYVYVPNDTFPQLISAGPDRLFGTGDDIVSKGRR